MTHPHLPETATTTTAVKPPPSPPHPDQPVPMVHANTQNNHTTLVVMSAHYGSQMLINTMVGFDLLVQTYTNTGTITEGQLHAALWPETGLLNQTSTVFGPGVVSYIKDRDLFSIRVGIHNRYLETKQMQRIVTAIAAFNGTAANNTALARRAIYLVCAFSTTGTCLFSIRRSSSNKHSSDNTLPLIDYARNLHSYVPDIDEQLAQIATTPHRPMRHGVVASHYQTSTATDHSTHAAVLPAYIGRDGGVCTSTTSLHYGRTQRDTQQSSQHNSSKPDRVITANPAVMCNIDVDDLHGVLNTTDTHSTTVELRAVLDGTGLDGADHTGHAGGDTAVVT